MVGVVLAVGLVLDLVWIRPEQAELRRLNARRTDLLAALSAAAPGTSADGVQAGPREDAPEAAMASADDRIRFLGESARRAGVRQRKLQMTARREQGPVEEFAFEMEVYGSFADVVAFLKSLESARPLIVVSGIHMMAPALSSDVTLRIQAAVISAAPAAG